MRVAQYFCLPLLSLHISNFWMHCFLYSAAFMGLPISSQIKVLHWQYYSETLDKTCRRNFAMFLGTQLEIASNPHLSESWIMHINKNFRVFWKLTTGPLNNTPKMMYKVIEKVCNINISHNHLFNQNTAYKTKKINIWGKKQGWKGNRFIYKARLFFLEKFACFYFSPGHSNNINSDRVVASCLRFCSFFYLLLVILNQSLKYFEKIIA